MRVWRLLNCFCRSLICFCCSEDFFWLSRRSLESTSVLYFSIWIRFWASKFFASKFLMVFFKFSISILFLSRVSFWEVMVFWSSPVWLWSNFSSSFAFSEFAFSIWTAFWASSTCFCKFFNSAWALARFSSVLDTFSDNCFSAWVLVSIIFLSSEISLFLDSISFSLESN